MVRTFIIYVCSHLQGFKPSSHLLGKCMVTPLWDMDSTFISWIWCSYRLGTQPLGFSPLQLTPGSPLTRDICSACWALLFAHSSSQSLQDGCLQTDLFVFVIVRLNNEDTLVVTMICNQKLFTAGYLHFSLIALIRKAQTFTSGVFTTWKPLACLHAQQAAPHWPSLLPCRANLRNTVVKAIACILRDHELTSLDHVNNLFI